MSEARDLFPHGETSAPPSPAREGEGREREAQAHPLPPPFRHYLFDPTPVLDQGRAAFSPPSPFLLRGGRGGGRR
jgi:hypothetical protein